MQEASKASEIVHKNSIGIIGSIGATQHEVAGTNQRGRHERQARGELSCFAKIGNIAPA